MKSRAEIKSIARAGMRQNYGSVVAITLLFLLLTVVISLIPGVGWLLALLIGTIITVGSYGAYTKLYKGEETGASELFTPFNRYGRVLGGSLWMSLWLFLWSLLSLIPFIVGIGVIATSSIYSLLTGLRNPAILFAVPGFIAVFIISIVLLIPVIIKTYSYFCTQYLLADQPGVGATQALDISKKIMKGNKADVFIAQLSFIGWTLLGLVIPFVFSLIGSLIFANFMMVIGFILYGVYNVLFLGPYINITLAGYYEEIKLDALERGVITQEELDGDAVAEPVVVSEPADSE